MTLPQPGPAINHGDFREPVEKALAKRLKARPNREYLERLAGQTGHGGGGEKTKLTRFMLPSTTKRGGAKHPNCQEAACDIFCCAKSLRVKTISLKTAAVGNGVQLK